MLKPELSRFIAVTPVALSLAMFACKNKPQPDAGSDLQGSADHGRQWTYVKWVDAVKGYQFYATADSYLDDDGKRVVNPVRSCTNNDCLVFDQACDAQQGLYRVYRDIIAPPSKPPIIDTALPTEKSLHGASPGEEPLYLRLGRSPLIKHFEMPLSEKFNYLECREQGKVVYSLKPDRPGRYNTSIRTGNDMGGRLPILGPITISRFWIEGSKNITEPGWYLLIKHRIYAPNADIAKDQPVYDCDPWFEVVDRNGDETNPYRGNTKDATAASLCFKGEFPR